MNPQHPSYDKYWNAGKEYTQYDDIIRHSNTITQLQNNITKNKEIVYIISSKLISGHTHTSGESL